MTALLGMAVVLAMLGAMLLALNVYRRVRKPHPEVPRKLMHVGMGLIVLSFPWVFAHWWPVVAMSLAASVGMLWLRRNRSAIGGAGDVLGGVSRVSLGEVYYPLAVGALAILSRLEPILFCVPMLILTLGDALAAAVGLRYGQIRYGTYDGVKSVEGSVAFAAIAFLSVHVPLLLFTQIGREETLLIATIVAMLAMIIEAVAWRGLDNLLLPLAVFGFLFAYRDLEAHNLVARLAAVCGLAVFCLLWRRRARLDDGALLAAALFAYLLIFLGGPTWVIAPATFFGLHVLVWPQDESHRRGNHVLYVVALLAVPVLLASLRVADYGHNGWVMASSACIAAHWAFVCSSFTPRGAGFARSLWQWLVGAISAIVLALLPTLACLWQWGDASRVTLLSMFAACTGVVFASMAFAVAVPRLYRDDRTAAIAPWLALSLGAGVAAWTLAALGWS